MKVDTTAWWMLEYEAANSLYSMKKLEHFCLIQKKDVYSVGSIL